MLSFLRRLVQRTRSGNGLYAKGLRLAYLGRHAEAVGLFEEAAERYRKEECVEKLARLRANELMVKYKIERRTTERQRIVEEVVLRLSKLREIESPEPPFAPLDAKQVLRTWMEKEAFVIGAGSTKITTSIEEEVVLAELDSALPCELIGAIVNQKDV